MKVTGSIYKLFFSKDTESIWKKFADENFCEYERNNGEHHINVSYRNHNIIIKSHTHYVVSGAGTYESDYTLGQLNFASLDGYKLQITNEGLLEKIGKLFGMQDIQVFDDNFDKQFVIKSNDKAKTQLIFSNSKIGVQIQESEVIRIEITDGEGLFGEVPFEGKYMVYCVLDRKIKSADELFKLKKLMFCLLDCLIKNCTVNEEKASS